MKEPRWIPESAIREIQQQLIAEHGGAEGLRDPGLLSASLARPKHLFYYNDTATLFNLAAAYAYGLAKNHCFLDGNKRIALAAIDVFLRINGYQLIAPETEAVIMIIGLVEGVEDEDTLAAWIRQNSEKI